MGIGRNSIFGMAADVLVFGLGIIVSIILTRNLGPEQRGVYVLLVTTNLLLSNLVHLSLANALSTMLARGRYRLGEANVVALLLAVALGIACLLVVTLIFPFISDSVFHNVPYGLLLVSLVLIPTTIYQMYWSAIMVGTNRPLLLSKVNLSTNIVNAVLMIFLVGFLSLGMTGFISAWTTSSVLGFAVMVFISIRMDEHTWKPSRAAVQDMLKFAIKGHGAQVAHQIFLRFDVYAVNILIGSAGVGYYSLATSLAEKLWLPLNAMHAASVGKIAQLPQDESAMLTAKITRTSVLLMISVAIPFGLISPWLIPFLYGTQFDAAVGPLLILLGGTLSFAVMWVVNDYILGQMQRPGLLSVVAWIQLGISVPLYITLILWQGIVGAAIASTITYLIAMGVTLYIFCHHSGLKLASLLIPKRADFADYLRVLASMLTFLPFLKRVDRRPS